MTTYTATTRAIAAAIDAGHTDLDDAFGIMRDDSAQTIVYIAHENGLETVLVVFDGETVDFVELVDNDECDDEIEFYGDAFTALN